MERPFMQSDIKHSRRVIVISAVGAPALAAQEDLFLALAHLRAAMQSFLAWDKPLQPHFADGELDKNAYERGHAMYIANHISQFRVAD